MSDYSATLLAIVLYKSTALVIGFGFAFLGYRLFTKGVYESSGDLLASSSHGKIILKRGAPGVFFALFGAAIVLLGVFKGMNVGQTGGMTVGAGAQVPADPDPMLVREIALVRAFTNGDTLRSSELVELSKLVDHTTALANVAVTGPQGRLSAVDLMTLKMWVRQQERVFDDVAPRESYNRIAGSAYHGN